LVARPDQQSRSIGALKRFFRWNPVNYWQVLLICALPLLLVWLIGYWVFLGKPLIGLVPGSITAIVSGAAQSYRLGKRRDAATTAEWTSGRHVAPPEP